jgi:hypothetical protein
MLGKTVAERYLVEEFIGSSGWGVVMSLYLWLALLGKGHG